ncbi:MAG: protein translocase subunit SecD [Clostridiales bacterium]|nr:protein translocase subunit SecD [Clostridiales bacterium]
MKSKGLSVVSLVLILLVTFGLACASYMGIGENHVLGVQNIKQGLDLSGGVHIVYEADQQTVTDDEMISAISLIRGRLDRKGYTEAEVSRQGEKRISVDIPGVDNPEDAINEIGQTAQLTFQDMEGNVLLNGSDVADATKQVGTVSSSGISEPYVSLEFTEEGKKKFADATQKFIGQQIAIVLDDSIISAPTVNSAITDGQAMITGSFTPESAEELAALIRAGSLPFNLNVLEMNHVGALLGANALQTSLFAGFIGILLVMAYMLLMYRMSGVAADIALIVYVAIELVVLSFFQVTLTLPGIAGIVLSIGMAVDANVIIFERIREELAVGRTLRSAIQGGFKSALPAIVDGNITTLIAAVILYWLGTGTVKGFAQTLMIGIVVSMFTALVITRIIMKALVGIGINYPTLYAAKKKL